MKIQSITILILLFCASCFGGEITFQNTHGVVFTNSTTSTNFVATGSITNVQGTVYTTTHCFQGFFTIVGTNAVATSNVFESTIDNVNWIPEQTNSWTTNGTFEYTVIGKRSAFRNRTYFVTTNANLTINYIAQ